MARHHPARVQDARVASFGWEAGNLSGNGVNVHFKVAGNMVLESVSVDLAASIMIAKTAGMAEILCTGGISRQSKPTFNNLPGPAYAVFPVSQDFSPITTENPHKLSLFMNATVQQDQFLAVILKSWIPADGTASAMSRNVSVHPSVRVNAGDFLVFHMDHQGIGVDAEMQVVLTYHLL